MKNNLRKKIITAAWLRRGTITVAQECVGKVVVHRVGRVYYRLLITEVEAYDGFNDKASHASRGKTKRNAPMFLAGGRWYVYLVYGMHWMLNVVTGVTDYPAAVLIRGGIALDSSGHGVRSISGPGRVSTFLRVTGALSGAVVNASSSLWLEDWYVRIPVRLIRRGARIGVAYAGEWAHKNWRFCVDANSAGKMLDKALSNSVYCDTVN